MRDYIEIGPVPCDEACQQVGMPNYDPIKAREECIRFRDLIRKTLGEEPEGAKLRIKLFPHDFGHYYEVVCYFDDEIEGSFEYALKCEAEAPSTWNIKETVKV